MITLYRHSRSERAMQLTRHVFHYLSIVLLCIACGELRPDPTIPIPVAAQTVQGTPGSRQIVRFNIAQTPDQVIEWYKNELMSQGWSINLEARTPPRSSVSFSSSGYRILFVLDVTAEQGPNGLTSVNLELKPQPPA